MKWMLIAILAVASSARADAVDDWMRVKVEELNRQIPNTGDENFRADSVSYRNRILTLRYTLTGLASVDLGPAQRAKASEAIRTEEKKVLCTEAEFLEIVDQGISILIAVSGNDGGFIAQTVLGAADCHAKVAAPYKPKPPQPPSPQPRFEQVCRSLGISAKEVYEKLGEPNADDMFLGQRRWTYDQSSGWLWMSFERNGADQPWTLAKCQKCDGNCKPYPFDASL